jgi:poly(A) polymerase
LTNSPDRDFACDVVRQLREAGYQALWAGGCVRDLLLGNEPKDYDVATSATPEEVRAVFGRRRTLPVGISFGVVIVLGPTKQAGQVEVATFRTDSTYTNGRHPDSVIFSNAKEDALRRDFTINGMFMDPINEQLTDYVGGESDLGRGLIRAIGDADARIAEDKLRMLRAIRFAAKFGFEIESETRAAVARHSSEVAVVSGERIFVEVCKTLETDRAAWAVSEWYELGLLACILPEIAARWPVTRFQAVALLATPATGDWLSKLSVLLWTAVGAEPPAVDRALHSLKTRLKFSNDIGDALRFALESQPRLDQADAQPWSAVQPLLVHRHIGAAMKLFELRASDQDDALKTASWLQDRLNSPAHVLDPQPLLDGAHLIKLGFQPGPQFRLVLDQVRRLQLDGVLKDRKSALEWVQRTTLPHLPPRSDASSIENK